MKYHFEFCIANATSEIQLTFPTAPMYIEGDSYNGRCKMWLKYASLPENDAQALLAVVGNTNMGLEFKTPSLNRFTLDVSGGQAGQKFKNNQQTTAKFCMPINNETIVYDDFDYQLEYQGAIIDTDRNGANLGAYPFYQSVNVDAGGNISIRKTLDLVARTDGGGAGTGGAVDAVAGTQETEFVSLAPMRDLGLNNGVGQLSEGINGDGNLANNRYANLHFLDGRNGIFGHDNLAVKAKMSTTRPSDGNARGVAYCYENKNMNDNNCMIIGSPWGQTITARTYQKSLLGNMNSNDDDLPMVGTGRFEIVMEPMVNDDPVEVGV